ncbi:MAG: MoxR family ATPase [bacterium]|uniref:ATPase associated with various cellular activities AAA_3 n=2 Tax=Bacteria candidate phyla TaxID=1783234 RepID=A0A101I1M8_UNCT6|nr:MAG: ATPase associated with various cellular activities AAA_3 [candidate division TA06 bacterium 32_111]KUK87078.1 MAG: ATPase associated with various cellular activities AAA_3 [candidate division TA06 bacterium 34_109]MDI6699673.1 MoxR family ATPase [bacterium]HCP17451.1 AAA family ATPase [candidate division WOR-3 bacterium]
MKMKNEIIDVSNLYKKIEDNVKKVVVGQDEIIKMVFLTLICDSHSIIVGVPGLAKTLIIKLISKTIDCKYSRIQFTPDLMPSDITGTTVLRKDEKETLYKFIKGPIFANIILADEINRTPPKTQAALLQSMEERVVTNEGVDYELEKPFNVFATQNPIEQEGTYPLPEAELDRFMFMIDINYPDKKSEMEILKERIVNENFNVEEGIVKKSEILKIQEYVKTLPLGSNIVETVWKILKNSRPETSEVDKVAEYVKWGASPRAGIFIIAAAKGYALLDGRLTPDINDVVKVAPYVLKHRLILSFKGEMENVKKEDIVESIIKKSCF